MTHSPKVVFIITGESSGESYGALLASALKERWPEVHIMGVGGERMQKAGVELISNISSAFGLSELLSALRELRVTFKKTVDALERFNPNVLILIDYPDFNLRVARVARTLGIKILYYVSPQVWAWRKGRVKKIASLVDRMAVILPFEKEIYTNEGVTCEFVGHPILEDIEATLHTTGPFNTQRPFLKTGLGLDADRPLLSLLPGSRPHELKRLLPLMIEVLRQFKKDPEMNSVKDYQFCVPLAPNIDEKGYLPYLDTLRQEGALIKRGEAIKILAASDMSVITSGTAALQAAFLEVPMVVIYKLSSLSYLLGKLVVEVKYISLVNLLSGRGVVTELIQQKANPEGIIKVLKKIMFDTRYREEMLNSYRTIKEPFLEMRASKRVAEIIEEMAGWTQ